MKLFATLALTLGLASTVHADDAKKPAAETISKADLDKLMTFLDKMATIVQADKDTCPKMATDINKLVDDNPDIVKLGAESKAKGRQLPKEAQDEIAKKLGPAMQAATKCMQDKDVQAAFKRLDPKPADKK